MCDSGKVVCVEERAVSSAGGRVVRSQAESSGQQTWSVPPVCDPVLESMANILQGGEPGQGTRVRPLVERLGFPSPAHKVAAKTQDR